MASNSENTSDLTPGIEAKGKQKALEEDTCRICRSEGSKDEPLFYPCKCNGSIRFVHQNCLMDWLSHSQKKHCELCKTPYRFTKLYHPHMPNAVPTFVFLRQAIVHTWNSLITWSRMHLVALVWLCWLPWSMRNAWRGMFWIGDGGWVNWAQMEREAVRAAQEEMAKLAAEGTSPAPPRFFMSGETAASHVVSRLADALPPFWSPFSQTLNLTGGEPVRFKLAKSVLRSLLGRNIGQDAQNGFSSSLLNETTPSISFRSSWLSDISFLRSLTRYPWINNITIDILEGQLITLGIVLVFILVFLIREWVVQQQPIMNLAAGAEARAPPAAIQDGVRNQQPPNQNVNIEQEELNTAEAGGENGQETSIASPSTTNSQILDPALGAETSNLESSNNSESPVRGVSNPDWDHLHQPITITDGKLSNIAESSQPRRRPSMPGRGTLARAAEVRRTIEEQSRIFGQDWVGLKIFTDLWIQAEHEPREVLRIINDENHNEELDWVVALMKRLENMASPDLDSTLPYEYTEKVVDHSTSDYVRLKKMSSHNSQPDQSEEEMKLKSDSSLPDNFVSGEGFSTSDLTHDRSLAPLFPQELDTPSTDLENGSKLALQPGSRDESAKRTGHSSDRVPTSSYESEPLAHAIHNPFHPEYSGEMPPSDYSGLNAPELPQAAGIGNAGLDAAADNHQTEVARREDAATLPRTLTERIMVWLWGEAIPIPHEPVEQPIGDDEHVVQDFAEEAPFVPMEHGQPVLEEGIDPPQGDPTHEQAQDQDVPAAAAAAQAGIEPNDAEAVEEAEDLEGIMELIGMQGPIAGLIQNGMFCAVLVSLTIFAAIWVPYIMGKFFLVVLANPVSLLFKMPLRWASTSADLVVDMTIFTVSCSYYWVAMAINFLCSPIKRFGLISHVMRGETLLPEMAKSYAETSLARLTEAFKATGESLIESDIPTFSIIAHESLRLVQLRLAMSAKAVLSAVMSIAASESARPLSFGGIHNSTVLWQIYGMRASSSSSGILESFTILLTAKLHLAVAWLSSLTQLNPLRVNVTIPPRTHPLDFSHAYWDSRDRALAILFGYLFFALLGLLYIRVCYSLLSKDKGEKVEGLLADVLYQAGGVMKVILIISIEMIVFPLYCGLLLDVALLPLFSNVTVWSRLDFMVDSPYTSLFVHWFVGTCYMFHFALFVSMCRRIMRSGVLYFIRDPDDPTFHPVRDVLERSVFTQLWKIAFSALVYGGLVIVCLGGVVWGISAAFDGVFPIHWSSNEPVLEFPVDLLFYNFLMPLAVKFFRPSDGLHRMYRWWFKLCARQLRLSHFLFGERKRDEEGRHVRRTWSALLAREHGDTQMPVIGRDQRRLLEDGQLDAYVLRDGRYVRTPASDQVRIPKGAHTFLEVDEEGNRLDGREDNESGLHGRNNEQFSTIYIPPHFRLRIGTFIFLIWLFAATTGVCLTLVPLVFGRRVFAYIFPSHLRMNDVYAFSIGINILGGIAYALLHARMLFTYLIRTFTPNPNITAFHLLHKTVYHFSRIFRTAYTYAAFAILLPALCSLVVEVYLVVPLHTYFGHGVADRHVIYLIQDWTLGVLYVKMAGRVILWNAPSRPANALRNIIRHGWTDPDVRLATKGFVFPATLVAGTLLFAPLGLGWLVNTTVFWKKEEAFQNAVYRYSYPGVLGVALAVGALFLLGKAFQGWKARIRDEVYLIGERLHNFGERRGAAGAVGGTRVAMGS